MTTGQNVHDNLPMQAGGQVNADNTLKALVAAVHTSWPQIRVPKYNASAATVADGTFDYSLSAITDITELGIGEVFVAPDASTDGPNIEKRGWRQYQDNSGYWHIELAAEVAAEHTGKALGVRYWALSTAPTAIGDTIALPMDYMIYYCAWWYAFYGLSEPESGRGTYTDRLVAMQEQWTRSLRRNETPDHGLGPSYISGRDRMYGRSGRDNPTGRYPR